MIKKILLKSHMENTNQIINLNELYKVAFETVFKCKKSDINFSGHEMLKKTCALISVNNLNDYLTGLEEKQSQPELNKKLIDTLLKTLSLCYLNNIDLNTIFKMEVK